MKITTQSFYRQAIQSKIVKNGCQFPDDVIWLRLPSHNSFRCSLAKKKNSTRVRKKILAFFESLLLNIEKQNIFQSRIKYCSSSLGGKLRLISAAINIKAQARLVLKSLFADDPRLDKKVSYRSLLIREKGPMAKSFGRFPAFPSFFRSNTKLQADNRELKDLEELEVLLESLIIIKIIHSETVNLDGALPRLQNKSPLFFFVY